MNRGRTAVKLTRVNERTLRTSLMRELASAHPKGVPYEGMFYHTSFGARAMTAIKDENNRDRHVIVFPKSITTEGQIDLQLEGQIDLQHSTSDRITVLLLMVTLLPVSSHRK